MLLASGRVDQGRFWMSWKVPIAEKSERVYPPSLKGRVEAHRWQSRVLEANPWGDPAERDLPVYLPPSGKTEGRPLLVLLSGYTGAGWMHFQRPRFLQDTIVGRLDRLIRTKACAEALLVAPDCLTSLGGSQYLNSSATGRYEDYVVQEVVPWVQKTYATGPTAVLGTSSGGYGAVVLALRHPDVFSAFGSNAGDMYFEYCYTPDFPIASRELRRSGGPEAFLKRVFSHPIQGFSPREPAVVTLETLGYASCYSPVLAEPGTFELPFDWKTGSLNRPVWDRWLAWDPIRMLDVPRYQESLNRMAYTYVDGGLNDEYYLDVGARIFAAQAKALGVSVDLEEFDGSHADGGPRYDVMIPRLLSALGFPAPTT